MNKGIVGGDFALNKKNILYGYLAQIIQPLSTIVVLPFLLKLLSSSEIGLYFLMISIAGMVALLDFGFSPQFARNITFVFSGAKALSKEGISEGDRHNGEVDFRLLAALISAAQFVYKRIAIVGFVLLSTLGTTYVYHVTKGFEEVENSLLIWMIFAFSNFMNLYFSYYLCLLRGRGLISTLNRIIIISRVIQSCVIIIFLMLDFGLLVIPLSNFIFPIVTRFFAKTSFFDTNIKNSLKEQKVTKDHIQEVYDTIWYNARKLGLVFLGSYAISRAGLFVSGFFMPLEDVASFGLLLQIFGLIIGVSTTYFNLFQPRLSYLRVVGSRKEVLNEFTRSLLIFYVLFFMGSFAVVVCAPTLLVVLKANVSLPETCIVIVYAIVMLLEHNHSCFAMLISSGNKVPFVKPSLLSGLSILIGITFWFTSVSSSMWGMIVVPGLVQLAYNNWKWPLEVFKEFEITGFEFYKILINQIEYLRGHVVFKRRC